MRWFGTVLSWKFGTARCQTSYNLTRSSSWKPLSLGSTRRKPSNISSHYWGQAAVKGNLISVWAQYKEEEATTHPNHTMMVGEPQFAHSLGAVRGAPGVASIPATTECIAQPRTQPAGSATTVDTSRPCAGQPRWVASKSMRNRERVWRGPYSVRWKREPPLRVTPGWWRWHGCRGDRHYRADVERHWPASSNTIGPNSERSGFTRVHLYTEVWHTEAKGEVYVVRGLCSKGDFCQLSARPHANEDLGNTVPSFQVQLTLPTYS